MKNLIFTASIIFSLQSYAKVYGLPDKCYNKIVNLQKTLAESFATGPEVVSGSVVAKGARGTEDGLSPLSVTGFFSISETTSETAGFEIVIPKNDDSNSINFETKYKVLMTSQSDCKVIDVKAGQARTK